MKKSAISLAIYFTCFEIVLGWGTSRKTFFALSGAYAQEYSASERYSKEQLDNLLAPIALYPDPLLAQVLLAATFADQVDEAARWLRDSNNPSAVDDQAWDVSVKAVAHYPSVLYMMSDQLDWTTALGQAYVDQSTDVMTSVQRLRSLARSGGHLITNDQQQVNVTGDTIEIFPAQPQYLYVPSYDPGMVYFGPFSTFGAAPANLIFFGPAFPIGAWLNHGCDWRRHRIYYHGWRGDGWIARSRPIIHITNVYVNNRLAFVQINRNGTRRQLNYTDLNRYNSVHHDVNYSNLTRSNRDNTANTESGKTKTKGNPDGAASQAEGRRALSPAKEPGARERKPSPVQTAPQPMAEPSGGSTESVRPVRQPQRKELQHSPTPGSGLAPHTTGQRIHESKAGADHTPANAQSAAPNGSRPVSPGPEMR